MPDKTYTIANCEYQKIIIVSEMYKQGCQNIISEIDSQFFMHDIVSLLLQKMSNIKFVIYIVE
jgi:hypothetical protein